MTTLPHRSRATASTRATNVRALAPSGLDAPQSRTGSTSSSPFASTPHATVNSPHRPQATDATRTTGVPAPSGAGTPQSPGQERASKQAAQRHQPQHHAATAVREHRASRAGSGAVLSPTNTAAVGNRPEQPLGSAHPQMGRAPGPKGDPAPQPQTPPDASTRGRQPAARQAATTQAQLEPRLRHGTPIGLMEGPRHAPPEGPPRQTRTATPTDTTNARALGTVRPHAHNPTESPSSQAPATRSASAPGGHPPAPAQAEPASQRHHDPPAGPALRPTETPSRSCPARNPGPDPTPDPTQATVPADFPRSAGPGGQPGPTPVSEGHTQEAAQPTGDAATPPAPPAQPQRQEPTVDATEEMGGPPQRTEAPPPAADLRARGPPQTGKPRGGADQPEDHRAGPPGMAASGSGDAPNAGKPGTQPGEPVPDAEQDAAPPFTNRTRGATRGSCGRRPLGDLGASGQRKRAGRGATTGPTWSPREVRSPGNHTRHAPARSRQGHVARRPQTPRRLLPCHHGVLHE